MSVQFNLIPATGLRGFFAAEEALQKAFTKSPTGIFATLDPKFNSKVGEVLKKTPIKTVVTKTLPAKTVNFAAGLKTAKLPLLIGLSIGSALAYFLTPALFGGLKLLGRENN